MRQYCRIVSVVTDNDAAYAIGDLATLGGVSRRTVRYYVQEGLIPPPAGLGRGNHYGPEHLRALLRVKALQEGGHTLDDIRRTLSLPSARRAPSHQQASTTQPHRQVLARSLWRRLSLAMGVELHIASTVELPSHAALRELNDWCQRHLALPHHDVDDKDRD